MTAYVGKIAFPRVGRVYRLNTKTHIMYQEDELLLEDGESLILEDDIVKEDDEEEEEDEDEIDVDTDEDEDDDEEEEEEDEDQPVV